MRSHLKILAVILLTLCPFLSPGNEAGVAQDESVNWDDVYREAVLRDLHLTAWLYLQYVESEEADTSTPERAIFSSSMLSSIEEMAEAEHWDRLIEQSQCRVDSFGIVIRCEGVSMPGKVYADAQSEEELVALYDGIELSTMVLGAMVRHALQLEIIDGRDPEQFVVGVVDDDIQVAWQADLRGFRTAYDTSHSAALYVGETLGSLAVEYVQGGRSELVILRRPTREELQRIRERAIVVDVR